MKLHMMFAVGLCALLLTSCKNKYAAGNASDDEFQIVSRVVASYVEELTKLPDDDRQRVPGWLSSVESVKVLKVEKMGRTFKALIEMRAGDTATTIYFLVGERDGEYRVTGVL